MLFSDVEGHAQLKQKLRESVSENRIAHAQLFAGPEGSGALALAIAYARFIACENRNHNDACGSCTSCLKFNKLTHPDLHFSFPVVKLEKQKGLADEYIVPFRSAFLNNPYLGLDAWMDEIDGGNKQPSIFADEAHEIIRKLTMVSVEGGYKFMIIWLPELLNPTSANRLLKTLEEPTNKTILMLISEQPENILGTILSRCQLHKIKPYTTEECANVLSRQNPESNTDYHQLAEIAEGNAALALWMLQNRDATGEQLALFRDWMLACYQFHVQNLMAMSEPFQKKGREWQKGFLSYCLFMIRQTLLHNHLPDLVRLGSEEKAFIEKFSRFFHPGNYAEISGYINQAFLHVKGNGHGRIIFFDTSMQISDVFRKEKNVPVRV
jgi:DNA polymerase-3 subunit delta'